MKKTITIMIIVVMMLGLIAGCNVSTPDTDTPDDSTETPESPDQSEEVEQTVVTFWHYDGNPTSDPVYEEVMRAFEKKFPQYKVEYVGLPNDSYYQKYTTALATGEVPDVMHVQYGYMSGLMQIGDFVNLQETFDNWDEKDNIDQQFYDLAIADCGGKGLYIAPFMATPYIAWYNTALHDDAGVEIPKTLSEYMDYCERFADPANGTYYTTFRGGSGSLDNIWSFINTYAGTSELFDQKGNCLINSDKHVEALQLMASIYWNGWCTKDSVTNGFKEIVAEFGSGTAMYLQHNSSSLPEHLKNLGEDNFTSGFLTDDEGIAVYPGWMIGGPSVPADAKNKEGALELVKFFASAEGAAIICENEGRFPINSALYDTDWFKANKFNQIYVDMIENPNVKFCIMPTWLTSWSDFKTNVQIPDFQALLLKEKTAKEVLDGWAAYLTQAQQEFLANQ